MSKRGSLSKKHNSLVTNDIRMIGMTREWRTGRKASSNCSTTRSKQRNGKTVACTWW